MFAGCNVIGFAGSDEKCQYLENALGFDRAFNYKTVDIKKAHKEGAPKRVDCYFDNVRYFLNHRYILLYCFLQLHLLQTYFICKFTPYFPTGWW